MSMLRLWFHALAVAGIGNEEIANINRHRLLHKYDERRYKEHAERREELRKQPMPKRGHYDFNGNYIPEPWNAKYFRDREDDDE